MRRLARRLRDALALNLAAAITFHALTLACRLIEAKRSSGYDTQLGDLVDPSWATSES